MRPIDLITEGTVVASTDSISQEIWSSNVDFRATETKGQNSFLPKLTLANADCDWVCEMDKKRDEDQQKRFEQQREEMQKRADDQREEQQRRDQEQRSRNNINNNPMLRHLIFGF